MGQRIAYLLLIILAPLRLVGQEQSQQYEVDRIIFIGNATLPDDQLRNIMQTRESPSWFWKTLYSVSAKIGEKAEYFDPLVFETDYLLLKNYYADQGFFHASIDTSLSFDDERKRMRATFVIQEGPRSIIDTIQYRGIAMLPDDVVEAVRTNTLVKVGDPFIVQTVNAEVRRIFTALVNKGYVNVHVANPTAIRYTSTNNITLVFAFDPGTRFHFGNVIVEHDTTVKERIEEAVIKRHLDFAPGDYYSEAKKLESERNLNRLGVFDRVTIQHMLTEASDTTRAVDMVVFVRPRPFHELTPELGVNDEKNAFNLQFGVGYSNRNFFGGARNLTSRLRLNIQSIQDVDFSRVFGRNGLRDTTVISTLDFSTQMIQPFFITNKMSLSWTVSAIFEKDKFYYLPIFRNRLGIAAQTAQFTRTFVDWNLERISYTSIDARRDSAILARLTLDRRPQFNSIITLTIQRDKRNDVFSPSAGFFHSGTIEEAGLLPSLTGGLFGTDLPYSRYIKFTVVGQWYGNPDRERRLIWATRVRAGFAELYGGSPAPVPLIRRFFAGGSGSVRGWKARDLGAVPTPFEGGTAMFEANLETRWHLFKDFGKLWILELPKLSMVFFYDVGNVWTEVKRVRPSELAMATGLGLRFDTIAGPLRVDFGFRVYDPRAPEGNRWFTNQRFFTQTVADGVLHFGVGHTF